ncbi:MAG: hypothetical protein JST82_16030 [Bacteroidetes bacterium]|nr:hypothetical protein [Bacteroidota bacterium]
MSLKRALLILLLMCAGPYGIQQLYAQSYNADSARQAWRKQEELRQQAQAKRDSENRARIEALEAYRERQAHINDSMREVRLRVADSLREIRLRRSDSLAAIREYKESKYYKDSVAYAKAERLAIIQEARKARLDSIKAVRQKYVDSATASRKAISDSIKTKIKRRSDSLAAIRKYKESKRFADSVAVVRKLRTDSLKAARKVVTDRMAAARKKVSDSLAAARKVKTEKVVKQQKTRTDSLTKVKEKREKSAKAKEADAEKKKQLAFELKIQKKHKAYSNETMLKKRWGLPRQIVQNSFTRYNYFFNADRKMDEALLNMQRVKKDNYDSLLALYPFNPDRDSAMLAPDMDSIIRKVSVGIQIHDPRVKWGDDLYLIMGQAYFYKGNYEEAASSFRYALSLRDKKKTGKKSDRPSTSKPLSLAQEQKKGMLSFLQHRSVHNESILWLAHTYTQMRQEGNAEAVLDLLEEDKNFPEDMKGRLAIEKAFIDLNEKDYTAASKQLAIIAKDDNSPDWIRIRAAFINGQILQRAGNYTAAADNFKQVIDLYPKIEMDFYARKNLAYNLMYAGGDQEEAIKSLKKVLNDGKYATYYEQVYYVLGRLSANNNNNNEAISYLNMSIHSGKSSKKQKALSFATLGNVYYKIGDYGNAQSAYDSAAFLSQAALGDSLVQLAIKRGIALKTVTNPMTVIHLQDSLLALSAMTEKEQKAEVRKYIKRLQQQKSDSVFKAENAAMNNLNQNNSSQSNTNNSSPYANWYFSNPQLMQQGMNDFKRKWGNRPLTDNWRRSASAPDNNASNNSNNNGDDKSNDNPDIDENGLPTEESLLAFIPNTQEQKDDALVEIQKAYIALANSYIRELEDYPPALSTLDTLDKRFPKHEYKAESIYLRYYVCMRQNKIKEAQVFADDLLQHYSDSKWADLVRPTEAGTGIAGQNEDVAPFYDETYNMLMVQRDYQGVLARVNLAKKKYTEPNYAKKFTIVEGIALAETGAFKPADSMLKKFVNDYPTDSLKPWAEAVLIYINTNKPRDTVAVGNTKDSTGTITSPAPLPSSSPTAMNIAPAEYIFNPGEEHYCLILISGVESRSMGLKAANADFNKFKFSNQHLNCEMVVLQPQDVLIVSGTFKDATTAKIYMNILKDTPEVFKEFKSGEYQVVLISKTNYQKLMSDRISKPYLKFYSLNYK